MIRAVAYLGAAGIVWLAEGFLFSSFLGYAPWQTGLMAIVYLALFAVAVKFLLDAVRNAGDPDPHMPVWRAITLAPMLVVIVGSFASLPILLAILLLGKVI